MAVQGIGRDKGPLEAQGRLRRNFKEQIENEGGGGVTFL